jgi:hypothetical protein
MANGGSEAANGDKHLRIPAVVFCAFEIRRELFSRYRERVDGMERANGPIHVAK